MSRRSAAPPGSGGGGNKNTLASRNAGNYPILGANATAGGHLYERERQPNLAREFGKRWLNAIADHPRIPPVAFIDRAAEAIARHLNPASLSATEALPALSLAAGMGRKRFRRAARIIRDAGLLRVDIGGGRGLKSIFQPVIPNPDFQKSGGGLER